MPLSIFKTDMTSFVIVLNPDRLQVEVRNRLVLLCAPRGINAPLMLYDSIQ